jgi:hypothetical protein
MLHNAPLPNGRGSDSSRVLVSDHRFVPDQSIEMVLKNNDQLMIAAHRLSRQGSLKMDIFFCFK